MENLIDNIDNQCCVCLNVIDENNKCLLKCSHFLCNTCIDSWFDQNKTTCPMCRDEIKYYKHFINHFCLTLEVYVPLDKEIMVLKMLLL